MQHRSRFAMSQSVKQRLCATNWGFTMRAGEATPRRIGAVTFKPGETYYLGTFFANNLTQTSRVRDGWQSERRAYLAKYPELADENIQNVASSFLVKCWKMDVTDRLVGDVDIMKQATQGCR